MIFLENKQKLIYLKFITLLASILHMNIIILLSASCIFVNAGIIGHILDLYCVRLSNAAPFSQIMQSFILMKTLRKGIE